MKLVILILLCTVLYSISALDIHIPGILNGKVDIAKELGPKLSKDAKILMKGEEGFYKAMKRWQWWATPDYAASVDVKNEDDIIQTVLFANQHSIPFLPHAGGHGSTTSLGTIKNGIQINMRSFNTVTVSPSGTHATLGAGIKVKEVTDALWVQGKQTVTGCCECVGLTAVVLGGGHGILQGYHGLLADQLLSVRLVLANGTAITVSESQHPDLWWGLRGAGHNFGIVTSLDYKIYDVDTAKGEDIWSYEMFTYPATPENVRAVYTQASDMMDTQPEGVLQYSIIMTYPPVSPDPVIMHHILYHGTLEATKKYNKPFHDLQPLHVDSEQGHYPDHGRWLQTDDPSPVCNADSWIPGAGLVRFPVDVPEYNVEALVSAVGNFTQKTSEIPEFAASLFLVEQYSSQGVRRAGRAEDSAFPNRNDRLLFAPILFYQALPPNSPANTTLDNLAVRTGTQVRQILIDGAKAQGHTPHSYMNYAYGGETLEEMYGHEKWRLERLRELKEKYDPKNRFGFYAPILRDGRGDGEVGRGGEKEEL